MVTFVRMRFFPLERQIPAVSLGRGRAFGSRVSTFGPAPGRPGSTSLSGIIRRSGRCTWLVCEPGGEVECVRGRSAAVRWRVEAGGVIELVELSKEFSKGGRAIRALDGVSLTVERGEFLAIV